MKRSSNIGRLLRDHHLTAQKRLGQNFLVHAGTARRLVELAGVSEEDTVVELGVGFGALTLPIAERARAVVGIELDGGIVRYHQEEHDLPDNVELRHEDLLKSDFFSLAPACGGRLKIMANVPYVVSSPLLFKLIETSEVMEWAVLMLQKEVAQRLLAPAGTKEYGILSVLVASCAAIEQLMELGPEQFHPRPKVRSTVVKLSFHPEPARVRALPAYDRRTLIRLVKAGFQQRRKTLLNALAAGGIAGGDRKRLTGVLEQVAIPPEIRAERLTIEDFVRLAIAVKCGEKEVS